MSALPVAESAPDMLVTTYLQMTDLSQFRPAFVDDHRVVVRRMSRPDVGFYRFLYGEVGKDWRWRDRLLLSDDELLAAISRPTTAVYVLYVDGVPAGYVELDRQGDTTEIAYFGLRRAYHGSGYGKHLLSYGIARAWADGARRVWLHTCNLDSPHALSNYLKRGFSVYDVHEKPMPSRYL
jgi:GNAT superfamily N-acetyltransferase